MEKTLIKTNSTNVLTGTPVLEILIEDEAGSLDGKWLLLNGIAATSRAEAVRATQGASDERGLPTGKSEEALTGRTLLRFEKSEANAEAFRSLKRIAPKSRVEIAEVTA